MATQSQAAAPTAKIMAIAATSMDEKQHPADQPTKPHPIVGTERTTLAHRQKKSEEHHSRRHGRRTSKRRGNLKGMDGLTKWFSPRPGGGITGGKVTRTYTMQINAFNTIGTASFSQFLGVGLDCAALSNAPVLTLFAGRAVPGVGTSIADFADFPTENVMLSQLFKWITIEKMEMELIPLINENVNLVTNNPATAGQEQQIQNDLGIVYYGTHTGDEQLFVNTTGIARYSDNHVRQLPHKSWNPVGRHAGRIAVKPFSPQLTVPSAGGTTQDVYYPHSRPIQTITTLSTAVVPTFFPHYGIWFYWSCPNLQNMAIGETKAFTLRFNVDVTWNTIVDPGIYSLDEQKDNTAFEQQVEAMAGKPVGLQVAGSDEQKLYPKDVSKLYPAASAEDVTPETTAGEDVIEEYIKVNQQSSQPPTLKPILKPVLSRASSQLKR